MKSSFIDPKLQLDSKATNIHELSIAEDANLPVIGFVEDMSKLI